MVIKPSQLQTEFHSVNLTAPLNDDANSIVKKHSDGGVYFYAGYSSSEQQETAVRFEESTVHIKNPINVTSQAAPSKIGLYFFSFSVIATINDTAGYIQVNGAVNSTASANNNLLET